MNENINKNIWQVFELASQAAKEAGALLDLIGSNLTERFANDLPSIKQINYLDQNSDTDKSGWIYCNETRSYDVTPKGKGRRKAIYLIGVQVVFFDPESNITLNQATLNISLQCDSSSEPFDAENWFCSNGDWEGYSVQTNGMTIANLNDANEFSQEDGSDILFSIPLGALNSPDDVELKVISPLRALLEYLDPNASEVVEAFNNAKDIMKLDAIRFQK